MRVLIYYDENMLKPVGGPTGYLYNLRNELLRENIDEVEFLNIKPGIKKRIFNKIPVFIKKRIKNYRDKKRIYKQLTSKTFKSNIDLNKYDAIHFHTTLSMYMIKDSLKEYKGKVIFSTHTPKAPFKELIEDAISKDEYKENYKVYNKLEEVDQYAFNNADYIIFPCTEAEEPYYNTWEKYEQIKKNNEYKYKYLPTGIEDAKKDKFVDFRKKYGIPSDAFIISYVGRHNEVKGYNQLKKFAEKILNKYNNVYFLIGGKEDPLKGLENPRWIEVGWTDQAHDLIASSNVFVLPNKETYFDLILIEVLSLGKNVILTNTGGNKYFKKYHSNEMYFYDYNNYNDFFNKFKIVYNKFIENKLTETENRKIYCNNFTISNFTQKYLQLLKEITKSK